ncbi:unnamed protein product [Arctogadus glacialis]
MWPVHCRHDTFCKWIYTIQSSVIKITQRKPKAQDVQGPLHHTKPQPLPTSFNRIDESNRSAENEEMIIKFNTAYNITKEELPFTKKYIRCYLICFGATK